MLKITSAGRKSSHISLDARVMILIVGEKNFPNYPANCRISNAGKTTCLIYPVRPQISNASKTNYQISHARF